MTAPEESHPQESCDHGASATGSNGKFAFGRNWSRFLAAVDGERVDHAARSLQELLGLTDLEGKRFLDAGSGSGLFSLAAHQLGADVVSFDADEESVACAHELHRRFLGTERWTILDGSVLDRHFLATLGQFQVVYCWGVLHHTGAMWDALDSLQSCVAEEGLLTIAIYNDEQHISRLWWGVKRVYQRLPRFLRSPYVLFIGALCVARRAASTLAASMLRLLTLRNPFVPMINWLREGRSRGMHGWYDLVDWIGGWPYEVAKPEQVFRFLRDRGFILQDLTTCAGHGCNEFVFIRRLGQGADVVRDV